MPLLELKLHRRKRRWVEQAVWLQQSTPASTARLTTACTAQRCALDTVLAACAATTLCAKYNDIESVKQIFADNKDEIAGVILEPVCGQLRFHCAHPGVSAGGVGTHLHPATDGLSPSHHPSAEHMCCVQQNLTSAPLYTFLNLNG